MNGKAGWNEQHTLIYAHISAFVLPSAHCSQTNPSSFMSLRGLLLPLIHGGRLSSAFTQPISTVPMNIWTGPSTGLRLPHRTACWIQDAQPWQMIRLPSEGRERARGGLENVIIVCLMHGEMGTGVFILEHCVDGCSLYVGKVSFDSCRLWLMGVLGRERKKWEFADRNCVLWSCFRAELWLR